LHESIWPPTRTSSSGNQSFSSRCPRSPSSSKFLQLASENNIHGFENGLSFTRLIFNINRVLTPLHALKTEEEINEFFGEPAKVFSKEYLTPLFKNNKD
jgi:hypothetical protein